MLPSVFKVAAQYPLYPYVGAGYTYIKGPEIKTLWSKAEQKGTGFEVYGGVLFSGEAIMKDLYFRGELIYSNVDIKITVDGEEIEYSTNILEWNTFSIGLGVSYFF